MRGRWRSSLESIASGVNPRPVLIGPVSFLMHCHLAEGGSPLVFLDRVLPAYAEVIAQFATHGAEWVQLDEPALTGAPDPQVLEAVSRTYAALCALKHRPKLMIAAYGGAVTQTRDLLASTAIDGLHIDLAAAPDQMAAATRDWPAQRILSVGVVDATDPSPTDTGKAVQIVNSAVDAIGAEHVEIAPSMPLTFAPQNLERAPMDHVPTIETAAVKLRVLRGIADAVQGGTALVAPTQQLPQRRDLLASAL